MQSIKNLLVAIIFSILPLSAFSQLSVSSGGKMEAITPEANSGLDNVYILNNLTTTTISYTSTNAAVKFYKYTHNYDTDRVEIPSGDISVQSSGSSTTYTISNLEDSKGYVADDNDQKAIWIIDYGLHLPTINSLSIEETSEERCNIAIKLLVNKSEDNLQYYRFKKSNTAPIGIARSYKLEYMTLAWKESNLSYEEKLIGKIEKTHDSFIISGLSNLPLKDTNFSVWDVLTEKLGFTVQKATLEYKAVAVEGHVIAKQENDDGTEEALNTSERISAPLKVKLYGYANEPTAALYNWYIYNSNDKVNYIANFSDKNTTYTFNQFGSFFIRLEVSSIGGCTYTTEDITLQIAESSLEIPNWFSPGDSPGINDEFKVKHESIVEFKCVIFNRWGNKVYEFSDPNEGWDGKYKGKYVNPGVYFYKISARGSDGIRYNKQGDINITRSK
ncbi:gliding motility-associated C-terminal domain-containing protein [Dysgonomonas sp. 216]|uniref:T9SS type B sorting domain-containing protein n=1 Tax=Dysgonomonas sp. 216 TaxID=2302934 RepID=UPI0013D2AEEF|nr:gliding motility-associated C-terminal domain-containing protein [Dysgonomonas sp. 216]NDW17534.1 gliding motility-associated C-terminal domain-containing protein [Dysgonomonas sp. 216]